MTTTALVPERLYDLTERYLAVVQKLEAEDAVLDDVVADLQAIAGSIRDKGEAIACVSADLERRAEVCRAEAKRLSERAKRAEAHVAWLHSYVLEQLQAIGLDRLETPRFTLAIRTNPPACTVVDAALVPGEFTRTLISIETDRRAILQHVKTTGEVPAGVEITRSQRLAIS